MMLISKHYFAWAGVAVMVASSRVFAADIAAPSNELETITVTAQKRSETEQRLFLPRDRRQRDYGAQEF